MIRETATDTVSASRGTEALLWDSRGGDLLNLVGSGKKGFLKEVTYKLESEGCIFVVE